MVRIITLFISLVFIVQSAFSQDIPEPKRINAVRVGYGYSTAGSGDIPGHQLFLGTRNQLSNHSLFDVRLAFTLIERTRTWVPNYTVQEKSNGISLEADYAYKINLGRFIFYPSVGPAIRYSQEIHPEYIAIYYDQTPSKNITRFEAPSTEKQVLKIGGNGGLNLDYNVSDKLTMGIRASLQVYKGNTITFVGLTLTNSNWHL